MTNKNNHSVIRATAGGHVQPNKPGFVHLDLPTEGPRGGGWKLGGRSRQQGPGDLNLDQELGPQLPLLSHRAEAMGKDSISLGVSSFMVEKTGLILAIPTNMSNK